VLGIWQRPEDRTEWEVPVEQVNEAVALAFQTWDVWRMYADPPYWESQIAAWAGQYGEKRVLEWWTNRMKAMAYAIKGYSNAIQAGELSHDGNAQMTSHIGNAVRRPLNLRDELGAPLWVMQKERPDSPHKIDAAMAGCLAWEARQDAVAAGIGSGLSVYEERDLLIL
jgi:phage terminase large subunit-like protein